MLQELSCTSKASSGWGRTDQASCSVPASPSCRIGSWFVGNVRPLPLVAPRAPNSAQRDAPERLNTRTSTQIRAEQATDRPAAAEPDIRPGCCAVWYKGNCVTAAELRSNVRQRQRPAHVGADDRRSRIIQHGAAANALTRVPAARCVRPRRTRIRASSTRRAFVLTTSATSMTRGNSPAVPQLANEWAGKNRRDQQNGRHPSHAVSVPDSANPT